MTLRDIGKDLGVTLLKLDDYTHEPGFVLNLDLHMLAFFGRLGLVHHPATTMTLPLDLACDCDSGALQRGGVWRKGVKVRV